MVKYILKILVFSLPILLWFIIEGILPSSTFAYRPWEALKFNNEFFKQIGYFYPNTTLVMKSEGELCHHTKHTIFKKEKWITDKLGNRNDKFIENPDVLVIGDSFISGVAINQDSTFTNQLNRELGDQTTVYNISPASFYKIDDYLKLNLIKTPKTIIYSFSEDYGPKPLKYTNVPPHSIKREIKNKIWSHPIASKLLILLDKSIRQYSLKWARARISNKKGEGVPGIKGTNIFFWDGINRKYLYDDLDEITQNIVSYKQYCDSIGSEFILLPLPTTETVYYDYVPFQKQPDYLFKLDSLLRENGVKTVNTLKIFNDYRKTHTSLIYNTDDTHWNSKGIWLVAKEVAKILSPESDYVAKE